MSDNFFSRWSRRKQDAAVGRTLDEPQPSGVLTPAQALSPSAQDASSPAPAVAAAKPVAHFDPAAQLDPEETEAPLPSLQDTQALNPESDFQPFMRRGVTPDVRNAAMKKLFADPHFNVMDGLDIYIGDYTQPDPLPAGMLEQMVGAQFLNLVPPQGAEPDTAPDGGNARAGAETTTAQNPQSQQGVAVVAQSPDSAAPTAVTKTDHDDTDLQLQPDPAAADPQAGSSAR